MRPIITMRLNVLALQGPEHEELDGFLLGLVEPLVAAVLHHADEQEEAKSEEMRAIVLRKRHKLSLMAILDSGPERFCYTFPRHRNFRAVHYLVKIAGIFFFS